MALWKQTTATRPQVVLKPPEARSIGPDCFDVRKAGRLKSQCPWEKVPARSHALLAGLYKTKAQVHEIIQMTRSSQLNKTRAVSRDPTGKNSRRRNRTLITLLCSVDAATAVSHTFRRHINLRRKATSGARTAHSYKSVLVTGGFDRQSNISDRILQISDTSRGNCWRNQR